MNFQLPKLKYGYGDLSPVIDAKTMEIHYTKHHQAYVDNLNNALTTNFQTGFNYPITEILSNFDQLPLVVQTAVRNHGGGHANHSMFWELLSPVKKEIPEKLAKEIDDHFGSWDQFKERFMTTAKTLFGSGWAWLVYCPKTEKLSVISTANQDSPLMQGLIPILALDVWEHAYYLSYQNRRPEYIEAFWSIIDWDTVLTHLVYAKTKKQAYIY